MGFSCFGGNMKHPITWSEVKTYAALTGAFTVVVVILRVIGVIP